MTVYKVWIEIEALTDEGDQDDECFSEPLEVGVFDTLEEAEQCQLAIHQANWSDCNGPECN